MYPQKSKHHFKDFFFKGWDVNWRGDLKPWFRNQDQFPLITKDMLIRVD